MKRHQRIAAMEELIAKAKDENRMLTTAEQKAFDEHKAAIEREDSAAVIASGEGLRKPQGKLTPVGGSAALTDGERKYSLSRLLRSVTGDRTVDAGYELEVAQELARNREKTPESGVLIPLAIFQKAADTITSSPDTGLSLTGTDYRPDLIERINSAIFRPPMASALGVTNIASKESKVVIPRMKTRLTSSWIARDATPSGASDAQFDNLTMTPTTLSLLFTINRSFMYATNPIGEELLLNDARIAIETGLDDAVVNGTGSSNQPLGFLGSGGSTASANYGSSTHVDNTNAFGAGYSLRDEVESYLKQESSALKWLLHPRFTAYLKQVPAFSGSQVPLIGTNDTMWAQRSFVDGGYALPTPSGGPPVFTKGLFGDFSTMVACVFGDALELVVNPYADSVFAQGAVLVRALLDYNQCVRDPKRVIYFNGTTI